MRIVLETDRLILREVEYKDENDLFEMDSDQDVHLYIENKPVHPIEEIHKTIGMHKINIRKMELRVGQ
ncbi:hypothetical protein [Flavobacterium sp.]